MTVSIAFSLERMIDGMLAHSALKFHVGLSGDRLMTADLAPAIRRMLVPELASVALELGGAVRPDGPDDDADIMVMELELPRSRDLSGLRRMVEQVVAGRVESAVSCGTQQGEYCRRAADDALACLKACLCGGGGQLRRSPL